MKGLGEPESSAWNLKLRFGLSLVFVLNEMLRVIDSVSSRTIMIRSESTKEPAKYGEMRIGTPSHSEIGTSKLWEGRASHIGRSFRRLTTCSTASRLGVSFASLLRCKPRNP